MKNTKTKKNSAAKKLIPATSMLLVSATMLATSTYAWFTMSREVEITGIQLTASVPEALEISLGSGTFTTAQADSVVKLAQSNSSDDLNFTKYGDITAPDETANTHDWANTVDFSQHYIAGRLIPASSTDGNYIFKTHDASGVGQTVKNEAAFYNVTTADTGSGDSLVRSDEAGLHVKTSYRDSTDTTDYKDLKQGYYIDFPVWLRTSSRADNNPTSSDTGLVTGQTSTSGGTQYLDLGVVATITQRTATETSQNLYHAVRVAVLPTSSDVIDNTTGPVGVIRDSISSYYNRYNATNSDLTATMSSAVIDNQAVFSAGRLGYNPNTGKTAVSSVYGRTDTVTQASTPNDDGLYTVGDVVAKVPLVPYNSANEYGAAAKYVIRVWLEGEDENCWNETAGQDFNISLRFVKLDKDATPHGDTITRVATTAAVDADTKAVNSALISNPTTSYPTITVKIGDVSQQYTHDGTTYVIPDNSVLTAILNSTVTGTAPDGRTTYRCGDGTTFANEEDVITFLNRYGNVYTFTDGNDSNTLKLTAVS